MSVVVQFHGMSTPSLVAWRASLLARPPHDAGVYGVMIDAMRDWLTTTAGRPAGAEYHPEMAPPRYVARFADNVWVHYVIKPAARGVTRVLVIGVASDAPPDR